MPLQQFRFSSRVVLSLQLYKTSKQYTSRCNTAIWQLPREWA